MKNLRKNLFLVFSLLCCLLFFSSCTDFASIFRKGGSHPKSSSKNRQIAAKKTRGGKGKVLKGFFIWPVEGEVSSGFGSRNGRPHDGIDIRADKGTPVFASADGEVVFSDKMSGYGNLILIKHANGYFTAYAHNSKILVKEGEKVEKREKIAEVGDTGQATGYHLHFEIRQGSTPLDPLLFLPPE